VAFQAVKTFRAEVPPVLVQWPRLRCVSGEITEYFLFHVGMEGSRPYDCCEPFLGLFPLQLSLSDAQETQLLASSILGLRRKVS
jgi:hypothetical protein